MSQSAQEEQIQCEICKVKFAYVPIRYTGQDGNLYENTDAMPDGYLLPSGWICVECGACPNCGKSLEKEPKKRARMIEGKLIPAEPCDDCAGPGCPDCGIPEHEVHCEACGLDSTPDAICEKCSSKYASDKDGNLVPIGEDPK